MSRKSFRNRKSIKRSADQKQNEADPLKDILPQTLLSIWEQGPNKDLQPACFARLCVVAAYSIDMTPKIVKDYVDGLITKHYEPMADETEASPSPESPRPASSPEEATPTLQTSMMGEDSKSFVHSASAVFMPPKNYTDATGLMMCHANSTVMLIEGTCERALEFLTSMQSDMAAKICPLKSAVVVSFVQGAPSRVYTKWSMRTVSAKKEGGVELQDNIVDEQEEVYMNLINLGMKLSETTYTHGDYEEALDNLATKFVGLVTSGERLEAVAASDEIMSVEEAVDMYVIPAKMDDAMEWPAQKVEDDLNMLRRAYALDAAS